MTSLILRAMAPLLTSLLLLFSLLFLVRGHDAPGGGFIGGLIANAALLLHALIHGATGVRRLLRAPSQRVVGAGLLLALASGMVAWILEAPLLEPVWAGASGAAASLGTPIVFDLGVYLVVLGFGAALLETVLEEE